jgi:oxygen-independent coproporphyrinogen-3 oxidase
MLPIAEMFAAEVPRYTSYPTAPHFHAGIEAGTYGEWLRALSPDAPLSLYLHIPFCDTLCWFCGCHTTAVTTYKPVIDYCDLLLQEMLLVSRALQARHRVSHIHWGGGSPTMLRIPEIMRIRGAINAQFDVTPDADFSIEIDPRGLERSTVQALQMAGVTRASIGLQDCDPKVQRAINRMQSDAETARAISLLRDAGITSLNIDLVYGLPHQSLQSWEATLDFALRLNPDRLAVFGYAHVPQFKKHQALIPESALPGIELRFALAEMARRVLCAHGYVAVGLDHFAKPRDALAQAAASGSMTRNFQGYSTDRASALIGLGASAIGSLPDGYVQNRVTVPAYRAALASGEMPIARGVALSRDDRLRRAIIERLMCRLEVDLDEVRADFAMPDADFSDALELLAPMVRDGVVSFDRSRLIISPAWRSAARLVSAAFDRYLPRGSARHSASV